ncbi:hypothetical protein ACHAXR_011898 [Thalassiosira sp. AJA248-18]
MDPTSLAKKYVCQVCGVLPTEGPYVAEDGHFYHENCIRTIFAGEGDVISPATKERMGKKLIFAVTGQCIIEKLLATGGVDRNLIGGDSDDATAVGRETYDKAQGGSAEHMARLGRMYLYGDTEGIECSEAEGYKWCEKAADSGNTDGMAYQGICLVHGYGVDKNRNEGFELLVEAANEGSAFAAYKLGSFYYAGVHGFKEDRKRAQKWLSRADTSNTATSLSESERENIRTYLNSISPGAASIRPLETVPEQVDVSSHSAETVQRRGHDHDSVAVSSIGMSSTTGTTSKGSLSSGPVSGTVSSGTVSSGTASTMSSLSSSLSGRASHGSSKTSVSSKASPTDFDRKIGCDDDGHAPPSRGSSDDGDGDGNAPPSRGSSDDVDGNARRSMDGSAYSC